MAEHMHSMLYVKPEDVEQEEASDRWCMHVSSNVAVQEAGSG